MPTRRLVTFGDRDRYWMETTRLNKLIKLVRRRRPSLTAEAIASFVLYENWLFAAEHQRMLRFFNLREEIMPWVLANIDHWLPIIRGEVKPGDGGGGLITITGGVGQR
jgi:hypothetical protein